MGDWYQILSIVIAVAGGAFSGALTAGLWLGGLKAQIIAHIANDDIHVPPTVRDRAVREIMDREQAPKIDLILRRIDRLEGKIDELQKRK